LGLRGLEKVERSSDQRRWQEMIDAFNEDEFERLAELLAGTDKIDLHVDQSYLIDAAYQLCLACIRSNEDVAWHHKAHLDAVKRVDEFRQQLSTILNMVSNLNSSHGILGRKTDPGHYPELEAVKDSQTTEKQKHHTIWDRVRAFIDLLSPSQVEDRDIQSTDIPGIQAQETPSSVSEIKEATGPLSNSIRESEQTPRSLFVYCLGRFRVFQGEKEITEWHSFKGRDVFKYLLVRRDTPVAKDILMDVFWPDADPQAARRNLHQTIYSLRQTLRGEQPEFQYIWFENDCYFINPQMRVWLDFFEFEKYIQAGLRLELAGQFEEAIEQIGIAEGLYLGDFLEEDFYEEWPVVHRQKLLNQYMNLVEKLIVFYFQNRQYPAAVHFCEKILAKDRCYEAAHRHLMTCYLAQGLRHLAIRQYQTCIRALREEVDIEPSEETVALYKHILCQRES
jgi:DNA-binding SARP family transcriptional activator